MDKIAKYKKIVRDLMEYIASISPSDEKVETQLIMDAERNHYLLYSVGWEETNYREYSPFVHIDIKPDGKVWLQHDGTDWIIADWLVERGIFSQDIVIGFQPPQARLLMPDFAAA